MTIQAFAPLAIATPVLAAEPAVTPIVPHRGTAWDPHPSRSRLRSNTRQRRDRDPGLATVPRPRELALIVTSDTSKGNPIPAISKAKSSGTPPRARDRPSSLCRSMVPRRRPPRACGDAASQSGAQRADARDVVTANEGRRRSGANEANRRSSRSRQRRAFHLLSDHRVGFSVGDGAALRPAIVAVAR
jgi:hypothetical protein